MKKLLTIPAFSLTTFIIICLLVISVIAFDTYDDRQHKVIITGSVVLSEKPNPYDNDNPIEQVLAPNTRVKVLRIAYGKDYMALKVKTDGDTVGWITAGEGVEVINPE